MVEIKRESEYLFGNVFREVLVMIYEARVRIPHDTGLLVILISKVMENSVFSLWAELHRSSMVSFGAR